MELIEMVAYEVAHVTGDPPWRCTACEVLTKHTHEGLIPHLVGAHNLSEALLKQEQDAMFLYPEKGEPNGIVH